VNELSEKMGVLENNATGYWKLLFSNQKTGKRTIKPNRKAKNHSRARLQIFKTLFFVNNFDRDAPRTLALHRGIAGVINPPFLSP